MLTLPSSFYAESGGITTAAASLTSVGLEVRVHLGEVMFMDGILSAERF